MNKTIIVIEGATRERIERFAQLLKDPKKRFFISNDGIKVYKLVDNELFEIVEKLEKIKLK